MTFYELYQYYLNNPGSIPGNTSSGVSGVGPVAPIQSVMSPVSGGDGVDGISSVGPVGSVSNVGNVDTSAKGIAGLAASGLIGGPFGLAANIASQVMGLPSVSDVVSRAMSGLGIGGTGVSTGVDQGVGPGGCATGSTTDQGVGPGGCATGTTGPSTDQGVGPGGCENGGGGNGSSGAGGADAGTGPGGCGYATGGRVGFANGTYMNLPLELRDAINKFGFNAVMGKTVESGGGEAPGEYIPGQYTQYYNLMEAESGGGTGLKEQYRNVAPAPARAPVETPKPKPRPKPTPTPTPTPTVPQQNLISEQLGTGVPQDPSLDIYSSYLQNYEPTEPVDYQSFIGNTGPFKQHIETAVSGLTPFYKQQYQDYTTNFPKEALDAALRNLEFLVATGNRPSYLQEGGRVGFESGGSYWTTVQEMYDNAGGEAGTGLGLIDFANKYFPKMATGGRAGYLQGGLVSLLR